MFTENMSDQDWRMACLIAHSANYNRRQKEVSDQKRHQEALAEQKRAAQQAAAEQARAAQAAEQMLSENRAHNQELLLQNRIANTQATMLQALPMVLPEDRVEFVVSRLLEFVNPPQLLVSDLVEPLQDEASWWSPRMMEFRKRPPEEVVGSLILQSEFPTAVEKAQQFLPSQYRVAPDVWAQMQVTPRLKNMVSLLQKDLPSALAHGKPLDCPLEEMAWSVSTCWAHPGELSEMIAYLAIIIALWNDDNISETELVRMMAILKQWQRNLTDDAAYGLLEKGVELYNSDVKGRDSENLSRSLDMICYLAHPEQAAWIQEQLQMLAGADMTATSRQLEFLRILKETYEAAQKEKHDLGKKLFGEEIEARSDTYINFNCDRCNHLLSVPSGYGGVEIECTECKAIILVPLIYEGVNICHLFNGARLKTLESVSAKALPLIDTATKRRIIDIIAEQLGVDANQVTPEANLIEDLGIDELDAVELVMALEEEFGEEISDEQFKKLHTVGDVIKYVEKTRSSN